jgi:hypothetical protein
MGATKFIAGHFEKSEEVRLLLNDFNPGSITFANLTTMGGELSINFFECEIFQRISGMDITISPNH